MISKSEVNDILDSAPAVFGNVPQEGASNKYELFQTSTIIDVLSTLGWYPVEASQVKSHKPEDAIYKRHLVVFGHESDEYDTPEGSLRLVLFNSHDRSSRCRIWGGFYRWACLNTLIFGKSLGEYSIRHIGKTEEDVIEAVHDIIGRMDTVKDNIQGFLDTQLDTRKTFKFAEAALKIRYPKLNSAPFDAQLLLTTRRIEDQKSDLWTIFNVVQENILRGGIGYERTGGKHTHQTTREIKNVAEITRINRELWNLAESFIEVPAIF